VEPRIGQDVYAVNVQIGQVYKVVISPRSRRVSAVIVRGKLPDPHQADPKQLLDGWPEQERTIVVPVEYVDLVTTAVFLTLTALECARLPDFNPAGFVTPDTAWEPPFPYHREEILLDLGRGREARLEASQSGVIPAERAQPEGLAGQPAALLSIRRGQIARYRSGELGTVDHVLLEPGTGRVTHIVVRAGAELAKDTLIPVNWVSRIEPDQIFVDVDAEQLAALPQYQAPESDASLQADIEQRSKAVPAMVENQAAVAIDVQQGVVSLQGRVPSDADRHALNHMARSTKGVWEVRDNLVSDESLERAVTQALSSDPRTADKAKGLAVEVKQGKVILHGQVDSAETRRNVLEVARNVPGMRSVEEDMVVSALRGD
jgi:osmotically-inducible protein OsmY/sporulation protein YlmC with PRC-barrel domain